MPADGRALRHRLGGAGGAAVLVGAAVIALHVADDAWLRPRPGTAASDHLAAGLVPIAVIAALVWAQRRAGPRAGAALTGCLGVIGLLVGMEAAHDIATGAATGDDQTGAAALVAGAGLVALGAAGLWRARRRDGPAWRRVGLRALTGLGLSVGGEVMMTAAARSPAIAAVVSEGAGERSIREATTDAGPARWPSLPTQAVLTGAVALFSGDGPPPGLADVAGGIAPRPLLLVYGERGQEGERRLNPLYAEAAGDTATLWEVPGAAHIGGWRPGPPTTSGASSGSSTRPSVRRRPHPGRVARARSPG